MLPYVYLAVIVLCFVTFRSWRGGGGGGAVDHHLGAVRGADGGARHRRQGRTLPVIALGVGIGVDYALYLLSVQVAQQRQGMKLGVAYAKAVQFTGKVVALVGITLAAGVITWAFSPIKFQADMDILLTFMFLWNMLGALILSPALSHFLLPTEVVGSAVAAPRRRRAVKVVSCGGEEKRGAPQGTAARPPRPALGRSLETRYRHDRPQPRAIGEMVRAAARSALRAEAR